ncbi:hypothetical protein BX667DRAFT_508327 [Coemansia mojavensis]|nr:hypothetical protein BX667DRAFT_508327 [Coemansia mojavensis]
MAGNYKVHESITVSTIELFHVVEIVSDHVPTFENSATKSKAVATIKMASFSKHFSNFIQHPFSIFTKHLKQKLKYNYDIQPSRICATILSREEKTTPLIQ